MRRVPLCISLCKIGNAAETAAAVGASPLSGEWIIDPTAEEEQCMSLRLTLAVSPRGQLCALLKGGVGTVSLHAMESITQHATALAMQLDRQLMDAIRKEGGQVEADGGNDNTQLQSTQRKTQALPIAASADGNSSKGTKASGSSKKKEKNNSAAMAV